MRLRGCGLLQPPVHPARGAHAGELQAALRPPARRAGQPAISLRLALAGAAEAAPARSAPRWEEHTSERQSLMRISYAVFCLKKKNEQYDVHNADSNNNIQDI